MANRTFLLTRDIATTCSLALLTLSLGACDVGEETSDGDTVGDTSGDGDGDGDGDDCGDPEVHHDCEPYEPTASSDGFGGSWEMPNDEVITTFTTPAEGGGGIVDISLAGPPVGPRLTVERVNGGAALVASAAQEGETITASFEVGPSETYIVTAASFYNAPTEAYPIDFEVLWAFDSRVDCYEPNNSAAQARAIPYDTELQAYFLAPRVDDTDYDADHDDWYEVEVSEGGGLRFELIEVPADALVSVSILDLDDTVLAQAGADDPGDPVVVERGELPAGTYRIWVEPWVESGIILDGEERSDHLDTPYSFRASAL